MKIRETKYRNIFSKILVVFFTTFLVGCTCLPFSSPSSKTPINGAISYSDILTYIGVNASGDPKWDGWVGIADQDQTLSYSISPSSPYIEINKDTGEITVLANALFSNNFTVTATGHGEFQDSVSTELSIRVRPPFLYNVDNVSDDDTLELKYAFSSATVLLGGTNYLFVAGQWDFGFSVFSVNDDGSLVNVTNLSATNVSQTNDMPLDFISSFFIDKIAGTNYLFVAADAVSGVSIFSLGDDGSVVNVDNIFDSIEGDLEIMSPSSVTTVKMGENTYLYVTGHQDYGFSVFSVNNNGSLSNLYNYSDFNGVTFTSPYVGTTAVVGGTTYLFISRYWDYRMSVFSVNDDGSLNYVYDLGDDDNLELEGVWNMTTAVMGETTYLYVTGMLDDGISIFSVNDDGSLVNLGNIRDNETLNLDNPWEIITVIVEGTTYLFVASWFDGVSVFSVKDDGSLVNVANVSDNAMLSIDGTWALSTAVVGGTPYLFVSGGDDNGVSVFSINP